MIDIVEFHAGANKAYMTLTVPNDRIAKYTINIGEKIWKLFTAEQLYVKC